MIKYEIGEFVGDLLIVSQAEPSAHGDRQYNCVCKCGAQVVRKATVLRQISSRGYIASCGCRRKIKKDVDKTPTMI